MLEYIVFTVVGAIIGFIVRGTLETLWQKARSYVKNLRKPKVTPAKKWRKDAEARRARGDYKSEEERLKEAIREYQETGQSTAIPTEHLEELLETLRLVHSSKPVFLPREDQS